MKLKSKLTQSKKMPKEVFVEVMLLLYRQYQQFLSYIMTIRLHLWEQESHPNPLPHTVV